MNKKNKSFLLSILTLSFIFYSCSNLANDLQKRKNQNLFNITIQETSNGTVTAAKSSGIKAGEEVILSVTATTGYELKTISVTNTQNKDVAVAAMEQGTSYKFTMPASDVTVGAAFDKAGPVDITEPGDLNNSSGDTVYKIEHCQQSLTDTGLYDLVAIQYKRGNAGDQTTAVSSDFPGFTALSFDQQTINSNGNTIVRIYYDRNIITYTFELHGGNWEGSEDIVEVSGLYEATVNKPNRAGYHLSKTIPDVFGPENITYNVNWEANTDTPYKVRLYLQNVEGGDNYTLDEEISKIGTTDWHTDYYADSLTGFTLQPYEQKNIDGDGSCALDIYYDRNPYTVTYELNGGSGLQIEQLLYGACPSQIPVKEGYNFYTWYTENGYFDTNEGITSNITLYASWIDNSITYRFTETVHRLPVGTDGTFGITGEYVLFGDYPQSLLTDNTVTIDETITMGNFYGGSDGNLYYEYCSTYYKVEPIKWRVISIDNNNIAVLLAENILDMTSYGYGKWDGLYADSYIRDFLNVDFLYTAFTASAQRLIKNTILYSDCHDYGCRPDVYNSFSENKIYLLSYSDLFNSKYFPSNDSRIRTHTSFGEKIDDYWLCDWWLRSSSYMDGGCEGYCVSPYGELKSTGVECFGGVVPALSIYLPSADTN